jgi:hypothetical protein
MKILRCFTNQISRTLNTLSVQKLRQQYYSIMINSIPCILDHLVLAKLIHGQIKRQAIFFQGHNLHILEGFLNLNKTEKHGGDRTLLTCCLANDKAINEQLKRGKSDKVRVTYVINLSSAILGIQTSKASNVGVFLKRNASVILWRMLKLGFWKKTVSPDLNFCHVK